jgi:hypothetical protein
MGCVGRGTDYMGQVPGGRIGGMGCVGRGADDEGEVGGSYI